MAITENLVMRSENFTILLHQSCHIMQAMVGMEALVLMTRNVGLSLRPIQYIGKYYTSLRVSRKTTIGMYIVVRH